MTRDNTKPKKKKVKISTMVASAQLFNVQTRAISGPGVTRIFTAPWEPAAGATRLVLQRVCCFTWVPSQLALVDKPRPTALRLAASAQALLRP